MLVVPDDDAGGAEDLVGHTVEDAGLDQLRGGREGTALGALPDDADSRGLAQGSGALGVSLRDALGEHPLAGCLAHCLAGGGQEGVSVGALGQEQQPGVGAELPRAEREGADVRRRELGHVVLGEGAGQYHYGVDRRHLGVDRDGLGTRGRGGDEGETAGAGAGEADSLDARIAH